MNFCSEYLHKQLFLFVFFGQKGQEAIRRPVPEYKLDHQHIKGAGRGQHLWIKHGQTLFCPTIFTVLCIYSIYIYEKIILIF